MNQLQQQVQLAQQIARLQQQMRGTPAVGQRREAPVAVGQCGPTPWANCAPNVVPIGNANPGQILAVQCSPLGIRAQALAGGAATLATVAPTAGIYQIYGVASCNSCEEIQVNSVQTAGSTIAFNAGPFDSAAYNTVDCWCSVNWGCVSPQNPGTINFQSIGSPSTAPFLLWTLFGLFTQGWQTCYPGLPNPFVPVPPSNIPPG
jgi:hypothetical protein